MFGAWVAFLTANLSNEFCFTDDNLQLYMKQLIEQPAVLRQAETFCRHYHFVNMEVDDK